MKILKEDYTISKEVYKFLNDYNYLLNGYEFDELFKEMKIKDLSYLSRKTIYELIQNKIPNYLNYMTFIPEEFFRQSNINSINIPSNIKKIEDAAFRWSENLESVILPENLKVLPDNCFSGCIKLNKINLPNSLQFIGMHCFEDCESLKTVIIPEKLIELSSYLFKGCTSLETVKLHDNIKEIANNCFEGCVNLQNIKLPSKLKYLSSAVFEDCEKLTNLDLSNIESIYSSCLSNTALKNVVINNINYYSTACFEGCKELETVIIKNCPKLYARSFKDCVKLKEISLPNGLQVIENNVFSNCISLKKLIIPEGVWAIQSLGDSGIEELILPNSLTFIDFHELPTKLKQLKLSIEFKDSNAFLRWQRVTKPNQLKGLSKLTYPIIFKDRTFTNGKELVNLLEGHIKELKGNIDKLYWIKPDLYLCALGENTNPVSLGYRRKIRARDDISPLYFKSEQDALAFIENYNNIRNNNWLDDSSIEKAVVFTEDYKNGFSIVNTIAGKAIVMNSILRFLNPKCIVKKNI